MRLRHTCLWMLASVGALGAYGCGDDKPNKPVACEGDDCDDDDAGGGKDGGADTDGDVEVPEVCENGEQDGDETDVDCGGSCDACGENALCDRDEDCVSRLCIQGVCAFPACDDGVLNGTEEEVDCGGSDPNCRACPGMAVCEDADNCGPEAEFTLSAGGEAPVEVTATSSARRGTAALAQVRYDWGDGTGSGEAESHTYNAAGVYTVTQTVIDADGRVGSATQAVTITGFTPVRMSLVDQSTGTSQQGAVVPNVFLSDDGRTIEVAGMDIGGVRSDASITSGGSRVYYFEGERLFPNSAGFWGFGVGTATAPLAPATGPAMREAWLGATNQSFGVFTQGSVTTDFYGCAPGAAGVPVDITEARDAGGEHFGFVVDYRAASPTVYLIARDGLGNPPSVVCSTTLTGITTPIFVMYTGRRAKVGPQGKVNTGADTVNHPFFFTPEQVEAALTGAGPTAAAVIPALNYSFGPGRTTPLALSEAPVLDAPAATSVALGRTVTLTATATDAEDGDVTDKIEWADRSSSYSRAIKGYGGTFSYTPAGIGAHQVEVTVTDSVGKRTTATVVVTVTGTLETFNPVRFVSDASHGQRALVTENGLGAYFGDTGFFKDAVRVNQGIASGAGNFWYFEATRAAVPPTVTSIPSKGIGLVTGDAALNPYSIYDVPWSMSVNVSAGVWKNLMNVGNLSAGTDMPGNEALAAPMLNRYGFAVDYRGDHPVVHVLVGNATTATYVARVQMDEVNVPIYPFVYSGEGADGTAADPALTLNFGTPVFTNVRAALAAPAPNAFIDEVIENPTELRLGWGPATP